MRTCSPNLKHRHRQKRIWPPTQKAFRDSRPSDRRGRRPPRPERRSRERTLSGVALTGEAEGSEICFRTGQKGEDDGEKEYTESGKRVFPRFREWFAEMFCCSMCFSCMTEHFAASFSEPRKNPFWQTLLRDRD